MGAIQDAICKKIKGNIERDLKAMELARDQVQPLVDAAKTKISQLSSSPLDEVSVPDPPIDIDSASDEAKGLIESCNYLDGLFPDFKKLISGLKFHDMLDGLFGDFSLDPGFSLSMDLAKIDGLFGDMDFQVKIPGLDRAISCLASVCGADIQDYIDRLDEISTSLSLSDTGGLNVGSVISGLSAEKVAVLSGYSGKINDAKAKVDGIKKSIFKGVI